MESRISFENFGILEGREEMSAVESALDVLSRAATMVQGEAKDDESPPETK